MIEHEQLEEDLRALRAPMDPDARQALEKRWRAGDWDPAPRRASRWLRLRVLLPVAAAASFAGVAAVVVSQRDGDAAPSAEVGAAAPAAPQEAAGTSGAAADADGASGGASGALSAPAAPPPAARSAPGGRRWVEQTTTLALRTAPGDLQDAADGVVRETKRAGGVVDRSSVSRTEDGGSASFELRVPAERLGRSVAALSELGDVVALDEATEDITGSVTSASERLSDARAERRGILRALERADSEDELRALRLRLREVRSRIRRAEGELRSLRRRAELASVTVSISAEAAAGDDGGGVWTPGDAAGDAWRLLQTTLGVLLVALAVAGPAALVGLLGAAAGRRLRRRRREHALDAV